MKRKRKYIFYQNIILVLISLGVSIGGGELLVRKFLKARNLGPSFTIYDSFYGQTLKKKFSTQRITPEFTMKFTTNSDGFRGPELGATFSHPILFMGDSFTMGYGVNNGEEFPALVRDAMNDRHIEIPVINAGIGFNGTGRWIKFLRTEGEKFNPALIVLQIHANDFSDNIREKLFKLNSHGELTKLPVPLGGATRKIQHLIESVPGLAYSHLIGLLRDVSWTSSPPEDSSIDQVQILNKEDALLLRLLQEIVTICEEQDWKILVVLADLPVERLVKMETFFSTRNISTVVIPSKKKRPDLYYKVDGHWNTAGHRFTAKRVIRAIENIIIQ